MFNVYNLQPDITVSSQIHQFTAQHQHLSTWSVTFFSEYSRYAGARDIMNLSLINDDDQERYLNFLKKHESRIEEVIIHTDIYEDVIPYDFLKECLSALGHVKRLKISCNRTLSLGFATFSKLGKALNALASFEYLQDLDLDVVSLCSFVNSTDEDKQDFIHFLASCFNLEKFNIRTAFFDDELKIGIIDTLITLPKLDLAQLNYINRHPEFDSFEFFHFGKMFQSKSLKNLIIVATGKFIMNTRNSSYQSAQEQMMQFSSQLEICTSLQSLQLYLGNIRFMLDDGQPDLTALVFSIDALMPISHNKSLERLYILLPDSCFYSGEELKHQAFIRHFENSRMIDLLVVNTNFNPWDRMILAHEIQLMTKSNQILKAQVHEQTQILTAPDSFSKDFQDSVGQLATLETVQQLDKRLYQVDLRNAHWKNQQSLLSTSFADFRLYLYFCTILCNAFNNPEIHNQSSTENIVSDKAARIPSAFTMMLILSYLNQRDLSQMFQLRRGILKTVHEEIEYYLNPINKAQLEHKDFIYQLGQRPKLINTVKNQSAAPSAAVAPSFSIGLINEVVLNDLSIQNSDGLSIAAYLVCSSEGLSMLAANDYQLARMINKDCLNAIISEGEYAGQSVALMLASTLEGCLILAANDYQLAQLIDENCLNTVISQGKYAGESTALWLASSPEGCSILAANDYQLAKLIDENCLNAVISQGESVGESVAFWLASSPDGCSILAANGYQLAKLIDENCLHAVISQGESVGESVVFWLAHLSAGRSILAANDYRLALMINETTLNHVIREGRYVDHSVAFWLAHSPEGCSILAANGYQLAKLIDENCLNTVISQGESTGESTALWLAGSPEGCTILAANGYQLAKLIDENCLNAVISQGESAGESVAFWLAHLPEGRSILAANDCQLALMINKTSLNTIIREGEHAGKSVAFGLVNLPEGRLILKASDCRLAQLITEETLNHPKAQKWLRQILAANPVQSSLITSSLFTNNGLKRSASTIQNDENDVSVINKKMKR